MNNSRFGEHPPTKPAPPPKPTPFWDMFHLVCDRLILGAAILFILWGILDGTLYHRLFDSGPKSGDRCGPASHWGQVCVGYNCDMSCEPD